MSTLAPERPTAAVEAQLERVTDRLLASRAPDCLPASVRVGRAGNRPTITVRLGRMPTAETGYALAAALRRAYRGAGPVPGPGSGPLIGFQRAAGPATAR